MSKRSTFTVAAVAALLALLIVPASALGISRNTVYGRGRVWFKYVRYDSKLHRNVLGVPYSQSRWAYESGRLIPGSRSYASARGYRTDCSGFTSMCWNLRYSGGRPLSATTSMFGAKGSKTYYRINKAQLRPGDMILKSTVWGAPTGHAIVFEGWANDAQTVYWAMEQTRSRAHDGTILHKRRYGEAYYRPYRYSGIEDPYTDVEENISPADAYRSAADAARAAFPPSSTSSVPAVVVASAFDWGSQVVAASLAGVSQGPVLLCSRRWVPAATFDEIKRLKPKTVYVLGSSGTVRSTVTDKIASMGPKVIRIGGVDRFQVAANALGTIVAASKKTKYPCSAVYVVQGADIGAALSIAPLLARTGRPVLFATKWGLTPYSLRRLRWTHVKRVILIGGTMTIHESARRYLARRGYIAKRMAGPNRYATTRNIIHHAIALRVGFSMKSLGVASTSSYTDALAWSAACGHMGSLMALTPRSSLDPSVRYFAARYRKTIGKARAFGGDGSLSRATRSRLATALRYGK